MCPELITNGHVYSAVPPLFRVTTKKNEYVYLRDAEALAAYQKEHGAQVQSIGRLKGLGEQDSDALLLEGYLKDAYDKAQLFCDLQHFLQNGSRSFAKRHTGLCFALDRIVFHEPCKVRKHFVCIGFNGLFLRHLLSPPAAVMPPNAVIILRFRSECHKKRRKNAFTLIFQTKQAKLDKIGPFKGPFPSNS